MEQFAAFIEKYIRNIQFIRVMDFAEIAIIAVVLYYLMLWIKNTRAWFLMKGVAVILGFFVIATILEMDTILWIAKSVFSIGVTALVIILQPEMRKALEQLGQKKIFSSVFAFESGKPEESQFSDKTIREIVRACVEMGKVKTGALIVVKNKDELTEYERTGIEVDGIVTSQLLINIFEHNTPLHDGAIIVRGSRVTFATCYLPLSDNMDLSKDLDTRHRAGVGMSEATDAMVVMVSEETGNISVAYNGKLHRGLGAQQLEEQLRTIQDKPVAEKERRIRKGRSRSEKQD